MKNFRLKHIIFNAKVHLDIACFKSAKTESINIDSTKRTFYPVSFINDIVNSLLPSNSTLFKIELCVKNYLFFKARTSFALAKDPPSVIAEE
jgi:hypothetical protein